MIVLFEEVMVLKKTGAFLKLIRIEYSLFSAVGVIIAGLLTGDMADFGSIYMEAFFHSATNKAKMMPDGPQKQIKASQIIRKTI